MLPLDRIAQLFEDLTTYRPSEGTLLSLLQTSFEVLEPVEHTIEARLLEKDKVHADETGCRVEGKTQWMHVISDEEYTLLRFHAQRGSTAMEEHGFLPRYTGTVVHDCMQGYFKVLLSCDHALCNGHLLRECKGIAEQDGHLWAQRMSDLLKESWQLASASRQANRLLSAEVIQEAKDRYDAILEAGRQEWEKDPVRAKTGTRGRKIKSKAANLGERFASYKEWIVSFLWREHVPFDNNQALSSSLGNPHHSPDKRSRNAA